MARLCRGDADALTELFDVYGQRVFNLCRGILGNAADAEDATQEVFVRALEQAARFDGRSNFTAWLFRLAVNHTRNLAKAAARRPTQSLAVVPESQLPFGSEPSPDAQAVQREERAAFETLLCRLPPDQRTVLVLRELEQMSYQEISELLEIPVGTVTSRLIRARKALTGILRREHSKKGG